jgi:hypothetical protein
LSKARIDEIDGIDCAMSRSPAERICGIFSKKKRASVFHASRHGLYRREFPISALTQNIFPKRSQCLVAVEKAGHSSPLPAPVPTAGIAQ